MADSSREGSENPELRSFIEAAFLVILNRPPGPLGLQYYLAALAQGKSRQEIIRDMLLSDEFRKRRSADKIIESWFGPESRKPFDRWALLKELDADLIIHLPADSSKRTRLCCPVRDESLTQMLVDGRGLYEPHVTRFLQTVLREGDTFLDVGAGFGYFTVLGARLVGESGRVMSFEPSPTNSRYCKFNIDLNGLKNVTLLPYALWHENARKKLYASNRFLGGAHLNLHEENRAEEATVQLVELDELVKSGEVELESIRLVKIDIEGAEPFALKGMRETITRFRPLIELELNRFCLTTFYRTDTQLIWDILMELNYDIFIFLEQTGKRKGLKPMLFSSIEFAQAEGTHLLNSLCQPDWRSPPIDLLAIPKEEHNR
jgi:FkbM family methyltransferase